MAGTALLTSNDMFFMLCPPVAISIEVSDPSFTESPSASAAFDAYQLAQGERDSAVVEQAFESGYQTAMQMIIAGLRSPVSSAPFISEEQRQGERHDQN